MPKRLFIAINIPQKVKERINQEVERRLRPIFPGVKFVCPENWHLTLLFIGNQKEDSLETIQRAIVKVAENFPGQRVEFDRITYAPSEPERDASMIWLTVKKEVSGQLNKLSEALIKELKDRKIKFKIEHRPLAYHVTLLRFGRSEKFPRVLPLIDRKFGVSFKAGTIDLMESILNTPAGSHYKEIFSNVFKL